MEVSQASRKKINDPEKLARTADALVAWADDENDTRSVYEVTAFSIEVNVLSQNKVVWSAECEDEECALLAARTGWDEAWDPYFSKSRRIRFEVAGRLVATLEKRP